MRSGEPPTDDDGWIVVTDRPIIDGGRVTIPKRVRERYDVGEGDIIDLRIHVGYPDENYISVPEARIGSDDRVRIAPYRLELHQIGEGDLVDLEIRDTGEDYPVEGDE